MTWLSSFGEELLELVLSNSNGFMSEQYLCEEDEFYLA